MRCDKFKMSVVVPLYNEERVLPRFMDELMARTSRYGDVEVILVDDGSTDSTFSVIKELAGSYPGVGFIRFTRNFGHQAALLAGIKASSGDCVIMMDGDLQHPPGMIDALVEQWQEGFDIVNTVRTGGDDIGLMKRLTASAFYFILNKLTDIPITPNAADFRLVDRKVRDALGMYRERAPFLRGIIESVGFTKTTVGFHAPARKEGESKYSLKKMLKLAADGIFSFSVFPMRFFISVGLAFLVFDLAYAVYIIFAWLHGGVLASGWTSLVVLIMLLTGLSIISFGMLGGYVSRMFDEVRDRPRYLVYEASFGLAAEDKHKEGYKGG